MAEITLQIPDALAALPSEEQSALIQAGLYEATVARLRQVAGELAEALEQVSALEQQHGMSLEQYERETLAGADSFQAHEVYLDWSFWHSVTLEKRALLAQYQQFDLP